MTIIINSLLSYVWKLHNMSIRRVTIYIAVIMTSVTLTWHLYENVLYVSCVALQLLENHRDIRMETRNCRNAVILFYAAYLIFFFSKIVKTHSRI